jgi:hypothetical protein
MTYVEKWAVASGLLLKMSDARLTLAAVEFSVELGKLADRVEAVLR